MSGFAFAGSDGFEVNVNSIPFDITGPLNWKITVPDLKTTSPRFNRPSACFRDKAEDLDKATVWVTRFEMALTKDHLNKQLRHCLSHVHAKGYK